MAKRKGVNSRKRYVARRKKVTSGMRRFVPVAVLCCAGLAAAAGVVYGGKLGYGKIVSAIDRSALFAIRKITVTGNERLETASIIEKCAIGRAGKLYRLHPDSVVAVLRAEPWIERVRCVKRWWGEVVIEVQERRPVALISAGAVCLADEQGVLLPVEPGKTYDLPLLVSVPVVTRRNGTSCCDSTVFGRVYRFLTMVRREDGDLYRRLSQIKITGSEYFRCCFAGENALVVMGYSAGQRQLRNLRSLLDVLDDDGDMPAVIDMRYQNLAFVKNAKEKDVGVN